MVGAVVSARNELQQQTTESATREEMCRRALLSGTPFIRKSLVFALSREEGTHPCFSIHQKSALVRILSHNFQRAPHSLAFGRHACMPFLLHLPDIANVRHASVPTAGDVN